MKLEEELKKYIKKDNYPFHMPGHKRNPDFLPGGDFFQLDLTELEDTDDLHAAGGIILSSMKKASAVFGAKRTFFSVGGSTCGLLSAVFAMTHRGDKILVARNCHRSIYHAVCLNGLEPVYVSPPIVDGFDFCGSVSAYSVERAFIENPDIKLAVITSPTYEGVISDIYEISKVVHAHGAMLLVDAAHGAHLGFDENFPVSAVSSGADVAVQSLHKTLPCFTQTALVHICSKRAEKLDMPYALKMYETSSPSYLLMCGIDNCVSLIKDKGKELFAAHYKRLDNFYDNFRPQKLNVFTGETVFDRDFSKLVISSRGAKISGRELYYLLKDRYKLQLEMYTRECVLAVTSICDTDEGFEKLISALHEIDKNTSYEKSRESIKSTVIPNMAMTPYEAFECEKALVPLDRSVGKISGDFVYAYPPGIPILAPGEEISESIIREISEFISAGIVLQGSAITETGKINVIQTKKFI